VVRTIREVIDVQARRSELLRAVLIPLACIVLSGIFVGQATAAMRIMSDQELAEIAVGWYFAWTPWDDCAYDYGYCCLCNTQYCNKCPTSGARWVRDCAAGPDFDTRNCVKRQSGTGCDPNEYIPKKYKCCRWMMYPNDQCLPQQAIPWPLWGARTATEGKQLLGMDDECWAPCN
jgi:hypothetical protein